MNYFLSILIWAIFCPFSSFAHAAHPLITDDAGTQGQGKFQLEINAQNDYDREGGIKNEKAILGTSFSYGIIDPLDIVLGISYQFLRTENGAPIKEDGWADVSLDLKWRFYQKGYLALALKPGITLPTGDEQKGLGQGKATYRLFLACSVEKNPWAFHLNLGYIRNENKLEERLDLWHISLAATMEASQDLKLVANMGLEKNRDKENDEPPIFLLGGIIYGLTENFDLDFGLKIGLNGPETDLSVLAGLAWRF
ncbi:MAG: transporter [Thermodesulfobacteriota bacterium]